MSFSALGSLVHWEFWGGSQWDGFHTKKILGDCAAQVTGQTGVLGSEGASRLPAH